MVHVSDIVGALARIAPPQLAAEWDNVGLLVEPVGKARTDTVLLTIDLTEAVAEEAIAAKAGLIVAYHPPIFEPLKRLTTAEPRERTLLRVIAARIAVHSPHTALDAAPGGVNDWLVDRLGARSACVIAPVPVATADAPAGQGRVLELARPVPLATLVARIKTALRLRDLQLAAAPAHRRGRVATVALCPGAGGSILRAAPADVLFTGEMRHHDVQDALARGQSVILAGHTHTERGYLPVLRRRLLRELRGKVVRIVVSRRDRAPLETPDVRRRRLLLLALPLALLLAADQLIQWTALQDGHFLGRRIAPYEPPLFCAAQWETFARMKREAESGETWLGTVTFDAELGWTVPFGRGAGDYHYDARGARLERQPGEPDPPAAPRHLVTLGCSFTHGDEVGAQDAWPALLDERVAGWDVANLGVPAYGLDQALLRFRRDGGACAPDAVWLGLMPRALLRLVTLYHPALRQWGPSVVVKPRFRLARDPLTSDGDMLVLIPNPARTQAEFVHLVESQAGFFAAMADDDAWVARARWAYRPAGSHWAHWFATTRLFGTRIEGKGRDPVPWLDARDDEVFRLALALCTELAREATAAGASFRVVVLPDHWSLDREREDGRRYWQDLVDALRASGLAVSDVSDALLAAGCVEDGAFWMPGGHYAPAANRLVAETLAPSLADP